MLTCTLALGRIRQHHGMGGFTTSNGSVKDGHGNLLVKSRYDLTIADLAYLSIDTAYRDAEATPYLILSDGWLREHENKKANPERLA